MRLELPVYKRCLFCFPLRIGLIVWGSIDIVLTSIALAKICFFLIDPAMWTILSPFVLAVIVSSAVGASSTILLTIALVIGCFMKNTKILRIYYYITSTYLLGLMIICSLSSFSFSVYYHTKYYEGNPLKTVIYGIKHFLLFFSYVAVAIYLLLLVRSEIFKLDNGEQFRFTNNAAEAECTLETNKANAEQEIDSDSEIKLDV